MARDYFGGEQHVYSAAFKTDEIKTLADFAHTLVFNSPGQLQTSRSLLPPGAKIQRGLRINPEHSEEAAHSTTLALRAPAWAARVNNSTSI